MADLSNLKISESYQRVLQRDPTTGFLQDLVGDIPNNIIFNGTTLRYIDGNQQNGYVLTSDANGNASWAAAGGGGVDVYWSSSTANANAIVNSGLTTSKVGIGTTIPNHELSISGTVSASTKVVSADILGTGTVISSGKTKIGQIDAAGGGYTTDKILVAQGDGEVNYLTTAELKADIGDADYWTASTANANAIVNSGMTTSKVGIGTTIPNHELTVSGSMSASSSLFSEQITVTGTGENFFGGDINMVGANIVFENDQGLRFENAAGTEFGNILMNSSDNMVYQNLRSNKNVIFRAGNAGNEGNVIIQQGGTSDAIATFGTTGGMSLKGDLGVTGRTFLGTIDAAGAGYTNDKILVAQSNGEVEYLTTAELKADIGDADYWTASTADANSIVNSGMTTSKVGIGTTIPNHELSVSGSVSATSTVYGLNLEIGDDRFIGSASDNDAIQIKGNGTVNLTQNLTLLDDKKIIFGGGSDGQIYVSSDDLYIINSTSDKDILFQGEDGASTITALQLDMSEAGTATFNHDIVIADEGFIGSSSDTDAIKIGASEITISPISNFLSAVRLGDAVQLQFGASQDGNIYVTGDDFYIDQATSDKDIIFKGTDGGGDITALTLDMSEAGLAIFNDSVNLNNNKYIQGKEIDGTSRNILGVTVNDVVNVGDSNLSTEVRATNIRLSARTFIGTIDDAGSSYSGDKILVAQGDGEVEYLNRTDLSNYLSIRNYFTASTANANAIVNSGLTTSKVGIGTTIPNHELSVSGTVSASTSYVVGNATLTTDELDISSGNFTLDVAGDITLDANGADIILSDDGTNFGRFKRDTSDFVIKSETNNKDIIFKGQDGGSTITALTLDMSDAGSAIFNHDLSLPDDGQIKLGASDDGLIFEESSNLVIQSTQSDSNILIHSNDGGTPVNSAIFEGGSNDLIVKGHVILSGSSTKGNYAIGGGQGLANNIYFTPMDFSSAGLGIASGGRNGSGYIRAAGYLASSSNAVAQYASYVVPYGYRVYKAACYGSAGSCAVYSASPVNLNSVTALLSLPVSTAGVCGNFTSLTDNVESDGCGAYVVIQWTPASASDYLYGAGIVIEST